MKERYFESIIGALVILITMVCVLLSVKYINLDKYNKNIYYLTAEFNNLDGIAVGSEVKISGISVGYVSKLTLSKNHYTAVATLKIDQPELQLPKDTSIRVATSGLIGNKYLELHPGSDEVILGNQGRIRYTQSSLNMEDLIGKFISK